MPEQYREFAPCECGDFWIGHRNSGKPDPTGCSKCACPAFVPYAGGHYPDAARRQGRLLVCARCHEPITDGRYDIVDTAREYGPGPVHRGERCP